MPAALFGITNDALNLVVNLLLLFLIVLWLALIAWTFFDARRRLEDGFLIACATAASLFPFVGTIVYSILRPPEFLEDKRERELEIRASELRVRQLEEASCPNCEHPIERNFLRCPNCRARVKDPCESCGKPIDPRWKVCPYCEAPVRQAAPPERRVQSSRRKGREAPGRSSEAPPSRSRAAKRSAPKRDAEPSGREGARKQQGSARKPASGKPAPSSSKGAAPQRGAEAPTRKQPADGEPAAKPASARQTRSSSRSAGPREPKRAE